MQDKWIGLAAQFSNDEFDALSHQATDEMNIPAKAVKLCEPKYYREVPNEDPPGTRQAIDLNCFGKPDAILIVPTDPSSPILLEVDPGHTGNVTGVFVDAHRDGKFGVSYWDTTGSGKPNLKCYQADGTFKPTRCEKIDG